MTGLLSTHLVISGVAIGLTLAGVRYRKRLANKRDLRMNDVVDLAAATEQRVHIVDFGAPMPAAYSRWLSLTQSHAIFSTQEWFERLSAFEKVTGNAGSQHRHFWLFVVEGDTPVLAAPIEQRPGRLGKPHFRLLTNYYSPRIDLFYDHALMTGDQAWVHLFSGLNKFCPGWLQFYVAPLTLGQHDVLTTMPGYAMRPHVMSSNYTARVDTPEQYWTNRPSQLNNTLKRKRKQLQKVDHSFEVTATPTPEQIERYWEIYLSSWKVPEPSRCFIDWLIASSSAQGRLRMGFMYVEGKVVASQMWLLADGVAHIFKLAQDKNANQHSPGSLLTEQIINAILAPDDIKCIDFLLGGDNFKAMWMDHALPVYGIEVINTKTIFGQLLAVSYRIKNRLRPPAS